MIYVMSDIHGNLKRFRNVMKQIDLKKEDHLYILGDCIDRCAHGVAILKEMHARPNVTILLGNHEHMMLEALTLQHPENLYMRRWYRNGGNVTHARFKHCTKAYRAEVLDLIRQLPLNMEVTVNGVDYLLVHGAPVGFSHMLNDRVMDAVWTRLECDDEMPAGKTVIFGHTPTRRYQDAQPMRVFFGNRMIGIDCGAPRLEGRLACLRLDDMKVFYSEWGCADDPEDYR